MTKRKANPTPKIGRFKPPERFWNRVAKGGPNECWIWQGPLNRGYGRFHLNGREISAHRAAWIITHGPVEAHLDIDHTCHNSDLSCAGGFTCKHRACVNPAHLEPTTRGENLNRGRRVVSLVGRDCCLKGHPLTPENKASYPSDLNGQFRCRECARQSCREYYYRRKAEAS